MKYSLFNFPIICLFVFAIGCKTAIRSSNDLSAFIKHTADSLQAAERLPGIFIGVLNGNSREYYGAGFAVPDQKREFDSATIFEIGSITKTFTAYVLESVLKEINISDSSSIFSYLPDSVQENKLLAPITFKSLLNHTSGLPRLPDNMDLMNNAMSPYDHYDAAHLYQYLITCEPLPDGKSNYSNLGVGLAGVLAQSISGNAFEELLRKYIFIPFQIKQHPDSTVTSTSNKAQGYFNGGKSPYWFADILAPAGGLKCSAAEVLSYLQIMSSPTSNATQQIIDQLLQPTLTINEQVKICRTWHTIEKENKPIVYWHNGGTYGFSTFAGFVRKENKAVIVVINSFNKNHIGDGLGLAIMDRLSK